QDMWLMSAVICAEFINNHALLIERHRSWLGLVVVLQALPLFAASAQWNRRSVEDSRTTATLLFFVQALVTIAVPNQLRFYVSPIGWALEGLMLGYVGQRYASWPFQLGSFVAAGLATLGLLVRLPLHEALFTPVFNRPFGSWATVIAMIFVLY